MCSRYSVGYAMNIFTIMSTFCTHQSIEQNERYDKSIKGYSFRKSLLDLCLKITFYLRFNMVFVLRIRQSYLTINLYVGCTEYIACSQGVSCTKMKLFQHLIFMCLRLVRYYSCVRFFYHFRPSRLRVTSLVVV